MTGPETGSAPVGEPVTAPARPVLGITGLSKRFGGTQALQDVDLEIAPGEIHALIGPNGSGKSTLIKILAGYHQADPGAEARLDGEPFELGAEHDRLRFVHQELGLVGELSAMDNLALSRGFARSRFGNIRWGEQERRTVELVHRFGLDIDVRRPLVDATPMQRTVVAIAAALQGWDGGQGLLVLDEPTAVLPPTEVAKLLDIVREVRRGGASVLYVSHRLDEVFQIADRVTVIRGGRRIATRPVGALTPQTLASLMAGEDTGPAATPRPKTAATASFHSEMALEARELTAGPLRGLDFTLARGELLGIAGLAGSGHDMLPYVVTGAWTGEVARPTAVPRPLRRVDRRLPCGPARHPARACRPGRTRCRRRVQRGREPHAAAAVPAALGPASARRPSGGRARRRLGGAGRHPYGRP
ncbi:ATP-binding cassette domain-containing protein [Streptomyces sp. NBC_00485]|nr:ATP-binding cassette domain-containing protein [Streptomyces sp. NBC_00474]